MAGKSKPFARVITVEAHSKSGLGVMAAGQWYNFGRGASVSAANLEKGKSYEVSGNESEYNGKPSFFITEAKEVGGSAPVATKKATYSAPATKPAATPADDGPKAYGRALSAYELEKDVRIGVQGVLQSVLSSPILPIIVQPGDDAVAVIEDHARKLLNVVDKLVKERKGV